MAPSKCTVSVCQVNLRRYRDRGCEQLSLAAELNELQRRLEMSEEERHRAHAELQAEQSRLSSVEAARQAVSSELQVKAAVAS